MAWEFAEKYSDIFSFCEQMDGYIEANGLGDHACEFRNRVWERHYRIKRRLAAACGLCSVKTPEHPFYPTLERQIISLYPAWDGIRDGIFAGRKTEYPD